MEARAAQICSLLEAVDLAPEPAGPLSLTGSWIFVHSKYVWTIPAHYTSLQNMTKIHPHHFKPLPPHLPQGSLIKILRELSKFENIWLCSSIEDPAILGLEDLGEPAKVSGDPESSPDPESETFEDVQETCHKKVSFIYVVENYQWIVLEKGF